MLRYRVTRTVELFPARIHGDQTFTEDERAWTVETKSG